MCSHQSSNMKCHFLQKCCVCVCLCSEISRAINTDNTGISSFQVLPFQMNSRLEMVPKISQNSKTIAVYAFHIQYKFIKKSFLNTQK